jgi:hypothetical protein
VTAKALAAIAAAIAIAALLLSGTASALRAHEHEGKNPTIVESFHLRGSHGFSIGVTLENRRRLTVTALTFQHSAFVTSRYQLEARQPPGSDRISASLGKFGYIEMRFIRDSFSEEEPRAPICKGEKDKIEEGHFVGLLEFRGDRDFTRVRTTRAPGSVTVEPAPLCPKPAKHGPHKRGEAARRTLEATAAAEKATEEVHALELTVKITHPKVEFGASQLLATGRKYKDLNFGSFVAVAARDRGRIEEESGALDLLVGGRRLQAPDLSHLTREVVVEPPAPFLGSATLRREADQTAWTGDLRVALPGFGVVSLTPAGADVTLCADDGCPAK